MQQSEASQPIPATVWLPLSQFWNPFTGFDIVRFDDLIKPPQNQSLRTCIAAKYGKTRCS